MTESRCSLHSSFSVLFSVALKSRLRHITLAAAVVGIAACKDAVTPGGPASIAASAGDQQTGLAGYALNARPAVLVRDASNLPLSNVQVTFEVASGGGQATGSSAMTDVNGIATVGSWSVQLGTNTLTATVAGAGISGNPITFTANGASQSYSIDIRFLTSVTPAQQEAFDSAKAKWQRLIYGDLTNVQVLGVPAGTCGPGTPAINETIDDIIIYAQLDSIDGPGDSTILAGAGPCLIRTAGSLPLVGVMIFDTADIEHRIALGKFDEDILHEMGHVLGFGSIWDLKGLLVGPVSQAGTDPHFVGPQAIVAFNNNGGASYQAGGKVPVENCLPPPPGFPCGAGSYDSHWRESVFETELMTGFVDAGPEPLSVVTAAAMADLGYQSNYAASEPYSVTNPLAAERAQYEVRSRRHESFLRIPILAVDPAGRVTQVIQPR